ncbi:MAG: hypothetical protein WDN00_05315 [Limisphaerales bacterium]
MGINALLWFGAVFLSLPLIIAIYRKLEALGMLLADLRVKSLPADAPVAQIKSVITTTVPLAGAVGLGLLVFALSTPLLPSGEILIVLLLILAGLTFLLWRSFVKVYSKAQVALHETFAQTALPYEAGTPRAAAESFEGGQAANARHHLSLTRQGTVHPRTGIADANRRQHRGHRA